MITATIREEFAISRPAVSRHLRVLWGNGFTTVRTEGDHRLYALNPTPLREIDMRLERFRRFRDRHLDEPAVELSRGGR